MSRLKLFSNHAKSFGFGSFFLLCPLILVGSCHQTLFDGASISNATAAAYTQQEIYTQDSSVSRSMIQAHQKQLKTLVQKDSDTLLNLQSAEVLLLLNDPNFTRTDGLVESWQYRNSQCVLDVYFNAQTSGKGDQSQQSRLNMRVGFYDIRARQTALFAASVTDNDSSSKVMTQAEKAGCLHSFLDQRKNRTPLPSVTLSSVSSALSE